MTRKNATTPPRIRMVDLKPRRGRRDWISIGMITPPVAEPLAERAIARPRLRLKYVATRDIVGMKRSPFPMPTQRPWERKSW